MQLRIWIGGAYELRPPESGPPRLSIVKRLCELLEGSLELATKPGQGSTFRVILPCKYGEDDLLSLESGSDAGRTAAQGPQPQR